MGQCGRAGTPTPWRSPALSLGERPNSALSSRIWRRGGGAAATTRWACTRKSAACGVDQRSSQEVGPNMGSVSGSVYPPATRLELNATVVKDCERR